MEKELIWIFGHIPGFSATLPSVIAKLHAAKEKYLSPPAPVSPSSQMEVGIFNSNHCHLSLDGLALFNFFGSLIFYNFTMYRKNRGTSLLHWSGTVLCGLCL